MRILVTTIAIATGLVGVALGAAPAAAHPHGWHRGYDHHGWHHHYDHHRWDRHHGHRR